jgi:hypothetical protein
MTQTNVPLATVVLVHAAWADASSRSCRGGQEQIDWFGEQTHMMASGFVQW